MGKTIMILDAEYKTWISELSSRYRKSQIKAALKVNDEMLRFYYGLGKDIVSMKAESKWGSGFIKNLSRDLKAQNPEATCFSPTNLLYMKNFYLLYQPYLEDTSITQQLVEQLGTGMNRMMKAYTPDIFTISPNFFHTIFKYRTLEDENIPNIGEINDKPVQRLPKENEEFAQRLPKEVPVVAQRTFEAISFNPKATVAELSIETGMAERSIKSHIALLRQAGLIERVGGKTHGYWKILDGNN